MSTTDNDNDAANAAFDRSQQRAQFFIGGLLFGLAALLVYSRSLGAPIVGPDAIDILSGDSFQRVDTVLEGEKDFGANSLGLVFIAAERGLFGDSPRPYRAVSLAAHILSAFLVFAMVRRLLHNRSGEIAPLLCGFIFALHPLATTAVNAIRFQPIIIGTLCVLIVCEATVRVVFSPDRYRVMPSAIAVLAIAVGIGFHPIAYCAAPLAFMYDAAVRRSRGMSLTLVPHGPLWLIAIGAWVTASAHGGSSLVQSAGSLPFYIGKLLLPTGLSVYHAPMESVSTVFGGFILFVLFVFAVLTILRGGTIKLAIVWTLFAVMAAVYASGVVGPKDESLAYLAIPGIALAVAGVIHLLSAVPGGGALSAVVGLVIVIGAGIGSFARNGDYNVPLYLWGDPAQRYASSAEPLFYVGTIHLAEGENALRSLTLVEATEEGTQEIQAAAQKSLEEAETFLQEAVRQAPDNAQYAYYLGLANFYANDLGEAVVALSDALRIDPLHQQAAMRLGVIHQSQADASGSYQLRRDAIDYYRIAESIGPLPDDVRRRYALALNANGEPEEALKVLEGESTSTNIQGASVASGLLSQDAAALRQRIAAQKQAEQEMFQQLSANPRDPHARTLAAQPMLDAHRYFEAAFYLESILETDPDTATTWLFLGLARGAIGQADVFIRDWPNAPEMPEGESAWHRLARACIASGHGAAGETYLASEEAGIDDPLIVAGRLAFEVGRLEYARDVFNRAADQDPDRYEPWVGLSAVARKAGDIATADEAEAKARQLGAPPGAFDAFAAEPQ